MNPEVQSLGFHYREEIFFLIGLYSQEREHLESPFKSQYFKKPAPEHIVSWGHTDKKDTFEAVSLRYLVPHGMLPSMM